MRLLNATKQKKDCAKHLVTPGQRQVSEALDVSRAQLPLGIGGETGVECKFGRRTNI